MQILDLPIDSIQSPEWNANQMDEAMRHRLKTSIQRFGLVVPLVVRSVDDGRYETVGGAQRLSVLRQLHIDWVPCVLVQADDTEARLLSQCLNRIAGEDDLGLKADLMKEVLALMPQQEVIKLLPETAGSLRAMASIGQDTIAQYLQNWQASQAARLKHLTFQSLPDQAEVIEEALARYLPQAKGSSGNNPNTRGVALYLLCQEFLETKGGY
jgi:ParB family chromosome partitioning protein